MAADTKPAETTLSLEQALEQISHEKAETHRVEEARLNLEKELRKANTLISKSNNAKTIQQLTDENAKLKVELELLGDQKMQNQALKENIHHLVASSDQQRKALEQKLSIAVKELTELRGQQTDQPKEEVKPPPPYTAGDPNVHAVAEQMMEKAEIQALQQIVKSLRDEKGHLIESLNDLSQQVAELKEKDPSAKSSTASTTSSTVAATATAARSWWNKTAAGAVTGTAPAPATNNAQATSTTILAGKSSESVEHKDGKAPETPAASQQGAPGPPPATGTAGVSKWWSRGAAGAASAATPATAAAAAPTATSTGDQKKELESLKAENKHLQESLHKVQQQLNVLQSKQSQAPQASAGQDNTATQHNIEELRKEKEALQQKLDTAVGELDTLRKAGESANSDTKQLADKYQVANAEIATLREQLAKTASSPSPDAQLQAEPASQEDKLELQTKLDAALHEVSELKTEAQRTSDALKTSSEEAARFRAQLENLVGEHAKEREAWKASSHSLEQQLAAATALKAELDQAKVAAEEWQQRHSALSKDLDEKKAAAEGETAKLQAQIQDILAGHEKERAEWNAKLKDLKQQLNRAIASQSENGAQEEALADLKRQLAEALEREEHLKTSKQDLDIQLASAREYADTQRGLLDTATKDGNDGKDQVRAAQEEIQKLTSQLETLKVQLQTEGTQGTQVEALTEELRVAQQELSVAKQTASSHLDSIQKLELENRKIADEWRGLQADLEETRARSQEAQERAKVQTEHADELKRLADTQRDEAKRLADASATLQKKHHDDIASLESQLQIEKANLERITREKQEFQHALEAQGQDASARMEELNRLNADWEKRLVEDLAKHDEDGARKADELRTGEIARLQWQFDERLVAAEARVDEVRRSKEEEIQQLTSAIERVLSEKLAALEASSKASAEEAKSSEFDQLRTRHEAVLDETRASLQDAHKKEVADLTASFEARLAEAKESASTSSNTAAKAAYDAEIQRLKAEHEQHLQQALDAKDRDIDAVKTAHLEQIAHLTQEKETLQAEHDRNVQTALKAKESELESLQAAHREDLARLTEEQSKAKVNNENLVQEAVKAKEQEIAALQVAHQAELARLSELEDKLKGDSSQVVAEAIKTKDNEIAKLTEEHERKIADGIAKAQANATDSAKRQTEEDIARIRDEHEKALQQALAAKEQEVRAALESEFTRKLAESSSDNDRKVAEKLAEADKTQRVAAESDKEQAIQSLKEASDMAAGALNARISETEQKLKAVEEAYSKEVAELKARLQEKEKKLAETEKNTADAHKSHEAFVASLTERIHKLEHAEKGAAEKHSTDGEERFKREKLELEEKWKKEQKEKQKVQAEYEKHKKDAVDLQKRLEKEIISKGEELGSYLRKGKTAEQELQTIKAEHAKLVEENKVNVEKLSRQLDEKTKTLTRQLEEKTKELEQLRRGETQNRVEVQPLKEELSTLQSQHHALTAELEVARASLERSNKLTQEKEDNVKKLKVRIDEMQIGDAALKKAIAKLEKERDDTTAQLQPLQQRIRELEAHVTEKATELEGATQSVNTRLEQVEVEKAKLEKDNGELQSKLKQMESDNKILERKTAQIVKDLQKQLAKERKQREQHDETESFGTTHQDDKSPSIRNSNADLARSAKSPQSIETPGVPKVERMGVDLVNLAQENEALNKRAKYHEEELKQAYDRVTRLSEDLEQKSNVIRQYVLRDNAQKLQPDEKPKTSAFNLNILSSTSAMQRMDPVQLSQINNKMQKLLEELTTKMMDMEEQLRKARAVAI